jgi:hypothetical protein
VVNYHYNVTAEHAQLKKELESTSVADALEKLPSVDTDSVKHFADQAATGKLNLLLCLLCSQSTFGCLRN